MAINIYAFLSGLFTGIAIMAYVNHKLGVPAPQWWPWK
jgi:hypothetical protein